MIRTSFQALGVNGWSSSATFAGLAINAQFPESLAIDGTVAWEPSPGFSPERIQWSERQRTVDLSPSTSLEGWMLASTSTSPHQVGIVERIATLIEIDALDEDGLPVMTTILDGQTLFDGLLVHPIPAQGALSVQWMLRQDDYTRYRVVGPIDAVPIDAIGGEDVLPMWRDDLFGWNARHWDQTQIVYPDGYRLRLWAAFVATVGGAWAVRAKGRIGGYAQARGGRDCAGRSARVRS